MSDNLETSTEAQEQTLQPVDSVVTGTEEIATPQSDDGKIVIEVDEQESGQETSAQSVDNDSAIYKRAKAAEAKAKKAKEKAKLEHEARIASEQRENELLERIKQLESSVNPIVNPKPKRPTLEGCGFDSDEHEKALDKYEQDMIAYHTGGASNDSFSKAEQKQQPQFDEQAFEVNYYTQEKEKEVAKLYPGFSSDKEGFIQKVIASGGNESNIEFMRQIAHQSNVDIARAMVSLNNSEKLYQDLLNAYATGNVFNIKNVLQNAANNLDLKIVKKVDTLPTPDIQNSGPINDHNALVSNAKEKWMKSGSAKDFQAYQAAKKAAKAK